MVYPSIGILSELLCSLSLFSSTQIVWHLYQEDHLHCLQYQFLLLVGKHSLLCVAPVIDVLKWPIVLQPTSHLFLHLVDKHVHDFDHCKIPSWYFLGTLAFHYVKKWSYWEKRFPTIILNSIDVSFHCLLIDWMDFGWVVSLSCFGDVRFATLWTLL